MRVVDGESRAGTERLEKLEKQIKDRHKRIEELRKEIEKAKSGCTQGPQKIESTKKAEQLELLYGALRQDLKERSGEGRDSINE